ncbi:MAG: DUF4332 domain-containing protein [Caldilineales bacterium]
MELLGALIGVGVLAAAPGVPVLRGAAKLVVKGGMAVADATVAVAGATAAAAAIVSHQVSEMTGHKHEHTHEHGEIIVEDAEDEIAVDEMVADVSQDQEPAAETAEAAAAGGAVRPAAKAAVKSGMAVADAAKSAAGAAVGAAVVAGQQLGSRVGKKSTSAVEDVTQEPAPVAEAAAGDLLRVQGVGPKTAVLLNQAGITTLAELAATPVERLQAILDEAGPRYRVIDPTPWPTHAQELLDTPPAEPEPFDETDLLPILGIGPKTAGVLKEAGIDTLTKLAATPVERLQEILDAAGPRYRVIDPATWPDQAQDLLAEAGQA